MQSSAAAGRDSAASTRSPPLWWVKPVVVNRWLCVPAGRRVRVVGGWECGVGHGRCPWFWSRGSQQTWVVPVSRCLPRPPEGLPRAVEAGLRGACAGRPCTQASPRPQTRVAPARPPLLPSPGLRRCGCRSRPNENSDSLDPGVHCLSRSPDGRRLLLPVAARPHPLRARPESRPLGRVTKPLHPEAGPGGECGAPTGHPGHLDSLRSDAGNVLPTSRGFLSRVSSWSCERFLVEKRAEPRTDL